MSEQRTPPQDGTVFYVHEFRPMRWQAYKANSEQYRKGKRGRWQVMNEYGGWENARPQSTPDMWHADQPDIPTFYRAVKSALPREPERDELVEALRAIADSRGLYASDAIEQKQIARDALSKYRREK